MITCLLCGRRMPLREEHLHGKQSGQCSEIVPGDQVHVWPGDDMEFTVISIMFSKTDVVLQRPDDGTYIARSLDYVTKVDATRS